MGEKEIEQASEMKFQWLEEKEKNAQKNNMKIEIKRTIEIEINVCYVFLEHDETIDSMLAFLLSLLE